MEKCSEKEGRAEAIIAFDSLYTTNHLQMLKLLFPYLDMDMQHKLAVFIKWQELFYTLSFIDKASHHNSRRSCKTKKELDMSALLPVLLPYCGEKEKSILSQFSQMQSMMSTYQEMAQYLPMIQEMMGNFGGTGESGGSNGMMEMMMNMMSPEQQSMFSMFMEGGNP